MNAWICDCLNKKMDSVPCLGEDEVLYVDEVEKSSMLLEWNGSIVILLNAMGGSGKSKCSGNSCCVIDFNDWRMNMVGECSQLHIGISATANSLCPSINMR